MSYTVPVGTFTVTAVLEGKRRVEALVDTGATFSKMPASALKAIGVKPAYSRKVELGDGRVITRKVGNVDVKLNGRSAQVPVMFGKENEVPLIGATTLEILGLAVDPVGKRLVETIHLEM